MVYFITKRIFWPLIRLFVKELSGLENLPDKKCLYVFNHQSYLDGFLVPMMIAWHKNKKIYTFATTRETFSGAIWSALFNHFGAIRIGGSLDKAFEKFNQGHSLAIAPEGQRSFFDRLEEVHHSGAGVIALKTQCPIVPIYIHTFTFWNRFQLFINFKRNITIRIGKPKTYAAKLTKANAMKTTRQIMKEVAKLERAFNA